MVMEEACLVAICYNVFVFNYVLGQVTLISRQIHMVVV